MLNLIIKTYEKITFLIACLLAVFGMSAINHYDNLYVVGDACAAGWSPDDALEMTRSETVNLRGRESCWIKRETVDSNSW